MVNCSITTLWYHILLRFFCSEFPIPFAKLLFLLVAVHTPNSTLQSSRREKRRLATSLANVAAARHSLHYHPTISNQFVPNTSRVGRSLHDVFAYQYLDSRLWLCCWLGNNLYSRLLACQTLKSYRGCLVRHPIYTCLRTRRICLLLLLPPINPPQHTPSCLLATQERQAQKILLAHLVPPCLDQVASI